MRLRTFWAPGPVWAPGAITGVIGAIIAMLIWPGESTLTALIVGGGIGYFGGGLTWAILGVVGADVLEIEFDLADDSGRVRQSLLWAFFSCRLPMRSSPALTCSTTAPAAPAAC